MLTDPVKSVPQASRETPKKDVPSLFQVLVIGALILLSFAASFLRPASAEETALPILVNKSHPLPADYDVTGFIMLNTVETDLFTVKNKNTYADPEATEALLSLLADARKDGLDKWQISEAYRSVDAQQKIWDKNYQKYRNVNGLSKKKALQAVERRVAKPGCSEHHTGLAFDMTVPGKAFRLTPHAKWLTTHCQDYGFIIRYTKDKEKYTGITEEPWHIRYVGIEHARKMVEENLCLEEYIEKYQNSL